MSESRRPDAPTAERLERQIAELRLEIRQRLRDIGTEIGDLTDLLRSSNTEDASTPEPEARPDLDSPQGSIEQAWLRIGDAIWRAAHGASRSVPLRPHTHVRGRRWFYVIFGVLFPGSRYYRAYRQAHLAQSISPDEREAVLPAREPARGPAPFDVFVFPVIDWDFRHQRPQQLAEQMARRGHRVFYFATTFARAALYKPEARRVRDGVYVIHLPCTGLPPTIYHERLTSKQIDAVIAGLETVRRVYGIGATVSLVDHPFWWPVVERLSNNRIVYDCMDHHGGFSNTAPHIQELEQSLIAHADLVVTTSAALQEAHGAAARRSVLIRNAADFDHFAGPAVAGTGRKARPVIGYYGAIAEWFDADLVAAAARALPECDFQLIGATVGADLGPLAGLSNVRLLGEIPYAELPWRARDFDVCILPFRVNALTLSTNPVKVYEYLSMGKPVVSIRLPELALMAEYVLLAETTDEFTTQVRLALTQRTPELARARQQFARQHTWASRAADLERAIDADLPLVSVIVLTHNGLKFTEACLDALDRHTTYPSWELVLVDNGSTDGTPEYLAQYAAGRPHVRVIRHQDNLGFAAGNNSGARIARGEFLVFLNNDTYITPGWLTDLTRHFLRHAELGLLNPVTNNIGNEARIEIGYRDMQEMRRESRRFTQARRGRLLDLDVCAFFCVMIPRRVWLEVGELDEQFGMGFFEDDDYARRARQKGYRLACAEDVFVHHHLSASFDALGAARKREQFERNRLLFESKWGAWTAHQYRAPSPDDEAAHRALAYD